MIPLLLATALVSLPCERMPEPHSTRCALARQQFICWTPTSRHIRNDDPALLLFWERGQSITQAKIKLAEERINGCDR
jgi:hypothetical protein